MARTPGPGRRCLCCSTAPARLQAKTTPTVPSAGTPLRLAAPSFVFSRSPGFAILPAMCRLSIVIPSHRRADLLAACLRTVLCHRPMDSEVLVVDDGSPEGVVAATAEGFPGVRILRLAERRGFCVAANAGIAAAAAPFV